MVLNTIELSMRGSQVRPPNAESPVPGRLSVSV